MRLRAVPPVGMGFQQDASPRIQVAREPSTEGKPSRGESSTDEMAIAGSPGRYNRRLERVLRQKVRACRVSGTSSKTPGEPQCRTGPEPQVFRRLRLRACFSGSGVCLRDGKHRSYAPAGGFVKR